VSPRLSCFRRTRSHEARVSVKSILLFRHGKSDWKADYPGDHDRPLAKRGKSAARLMGRFLASCGQVPDIALTSTALRARRTLELASESGGWTCPVEAKSYLYEASPQEILGQIQQQSDTWNSVLLTGHEPTCSELASALIGGGYFRFPTAALMGIDFAADRWEAVDFGRGVLKWLLIPKLLASAEFDTGSA